MLIDAGRRFEKEREDRAGFYNKLFAPDPRTAVVLDAVNEVYPAFAQKMIAGNRYVRLLIKSNVMAMDILDFPVCGSCEQIALWDQTEVDKRGNIISVCQCMNSGCGKTTKNPITVKQWMALELKNRVKPEFWDIIDNTKDILASILANAVFTPFEEEEKSGGIIHGV